MGDPIDTIDIAEKVLPLAALIDVVGAAREQAAGARLLGRLALYHDLAQRLRGLSWGTQLSSPILRARPLQGEVDYAELIREHMTRYPKIRAALAK